MSETETDDAEGAPPRTVKKILVTARDANGEIVGQSEQNDVPLEEIVQYLISGIGDDLESNPETKLVIIALEFD
jgi:hypothetical protein